MTQHIVDCPRCGEGDERSIGVNVCGLCECRFSIGPDPHFRKDVDRSQRRLAALLGATECAECGGDAMDGACINVFCADDAKRGRTDPQPCQICGQRWFACGETMCPQPRPRASQKR